MNSPMSVMNLPDRVNRIERFDVALKLLPVDSVHRVVVELSESISIDPEKWIELFNQVKEKYEQQQRERSLSDLGYADFIREEIQLLLLSCEVLFGDEEDRNNIDLSLGDSIAMQYIDGTDYFLFLPLQAD